MFLDFKAPSFECIYSYRKYAVVSAGWVPFCQLTDPCHISSVPSAQVLLAEQQSLLVKANLLSPLEQEKSALLHNSTEPLLKALLSTASRRLLNATFTKAIVWKIKLWFYSNRCHTKSEKINVYQYINFIKLHKGDIFLQIQEN